MFVAIFNDDDAPVGLQERGSGLAIKTLGAKGQVAFLCSGSEIPGTDGETCAIHGIGNRLWIVGRVRLDGRRDLRARLAGQLGNSAEAIPDALLCLHAYAAWGERFVDFLAGDFSFVLWDEESGRLTCARDQMGIRALFHARAGNSWIISDSLDQIVDRTTAGRALDDCWIADFLTLGFCREFERTAYLEVHRLAPAHLMRVSHAGVLVRRYWRLNIAEPLYLRTRAHYTERFRELLAEAVADRLPSGRVGIAMSGGLDSTTMAACAVSVTGDASRVVAECDHYEELMHIGEDRFARLAAQRLGIDLRIRVTDNLAYDPGWRMRGIRSAEPTTSIVRSHHIQEINRELAIRAGVWFEGEGPDNALTLERNAYLSWLVRRRAWNRLGSAILQYALVKGGAGWAQTFRRYAARHVEPGMPAAVPRWLNRDFVRRVHLEERIRSLGEGGDTSHPWRPEAIASFTTPIWQSYFDDFNFHETLAPVVRRHPYVDLRLLEFMLSVPPVPWAWKKRLVREAMRGRLPDEVLAREKTPLPLDPTLSMIRRLGLPEFSARTEIASYVDIERLPGAEVLESEGQQLIAASALDYWLTERRS